MNFELKNNTLSLDYYFIHEPFLFIYLYTLVYNCARVLGYLVRDNVCFGKKKKENKRGKRIEGIIVIW